MPSEAKKPKSRKKQTLVKRTSGKTFKSSAAKRRAIQSKSKELQPKPATAKEAASWAKQKVIANRALLFTIDFLGCLMGPNNDQVLTRTAKQRLNTIMRAVSWVESKHGTGGVNQPKRDPVQCGNPIDAWWKELTKQSGKGSRFIRKPGMGNLWANQVAGKAERFSGFPTDANMANLANIKKGHQDAAFSPDHSYVWGTIYLIHRTNAPLNGVTYKCGQVTRDQLIDGAVAYNGGGDPRYRKKIEAALKLIGDIPNVPLGRGLLLSNDQSKPKVQRKKIT